MAFDVGAVSEPLDEREPGDLVVEAIGLLQAALPDWVARNGSPETIYLEAVAYVVAEVVNSGNDVVAAVVESLLENLYQLPRGTGVQATGVLTVTFDSAVSTVIPSGSTFNLPEYGVELASVAEVTVTTTNTTTVSVITSEATSAVNGVGATAAVDVLDVIPNALSVAISTTISGGADPEDDVAYIARGRNRLARVTNSLVIPDHFTAFCLESGLVSNATTIGAWDGSVIGTAGTDSGCVTSVTYGFGGQVSAGNKTLLAGDMADITAAGITVAVVDADLEAIDVIADVAAMPDTDTATVQAAVEDAITAYLDPETWEFGETVRYLSLSAVISNVTGVDYVDDLTVNAATDDVTLVANQITSLGTLTVTVT